MKLVILIGVIAAISVVAYGKEEKCKFNEKRDFSKVRRGPRSKAKDDAEAYASCRKGETLVHCECEAFKGRKDDCDGSMFREKATGFVCVAKNGAKGKGVVAKATCEKILITCSTRYINMPAMRCPKHYKVASCTLHSPFYHKLPAQPIKPRITRGGGVCRSTKGCDKCKVQVRCVRVSNF